jgi:hypothetical protein
LKKVFDSSLVTVFIDEIEVIWGFEGFYKPDNVFMLQRREDVDFVDG